MKKERSIKDCLDIIFDRMKPGEEFTGLWLAQTVAQMEDKYKWTFPDTILRVARKYHRADFAVKNRRKSIYMKTSYKE